MPSWNDGESSSQSRLGEFMAIYYAPDRCDDPNFNGITRGCTERCLGHNLEPKRCVAFEGTNAGRRFCMCPIENDTLNYGFISWVDDQEWQDSLQNALAKLLSMYDDANTCRIDERVKNGKMLSQLAEEKTKAEKNYASLMADVRRFVDDSRKKVMEQNLALLNGKTERKVVEMDKKRDSLKTIVEMLKHVQKTQAYVIKSKDKKWEEERDALKAERTKLEYMLYDLLKAGDDNKEKVK